MEVVLFQGAVAFHKIWDFENIALLTHQIHNCVLQVQQKAIKNNIRNSQKQKRQQNRPREQIQTHNKDTRKPL